jgi:hypothetical protein
MLNQGKRFKETWAAFDEFCRSGLPQDTSICLSALVAAKYANVFLLIPHICKS